MGLFEIIIISFGLAMDAFAVSVCKGLSIKKFKWKNAIIIAGYFGCFQGIMPLIGYFLGASFSNLVEYIDHWIAFFLLLIIGGKMVKESADDDLEKNNDNIDFKTMTLLGIATSIDALAIGVTFAFLKTNILRAVFLIGIITFVLSFLGVKIGNRFGDKLQKKAELMGGVVLILIGIKILLEHLGV